MSRARAEARAPATKVAPLRPFLITRALLVAAIALVIGALRALDAPAVPELELERACARARGRRRAQEDACVVGGAHHLHLVGVFDGHDGGAASRSTTLAAAEIFKDALGDGATAAASRAVAKALETTIAKLDEFWARSSSSGGATVVLAASGEDGFAVAHAGDSAAYACFADSSGRAKARRLTQDHGLDNENERKRLDALGVKIVRARGKLRVGGELLVTRALGGARHKAFGVVATPEIMRRRWKRDEMGLILTSDGTTDALRADDACAFVFDGKHDCERAENVPVIALGGDAGSDTANEAAESWDAIEFSEASTRGMRSGIERALKCALSLGASDNVALGALSSGRPIQSVAHGALQHTPSDLVAEIPRVGARISAYEITEMIAWSSGPHSPAEIPFRYDDYYEELPMADIGKTFEQSAIEGALAALALAPGTSEKGSVSNAITSYVDIVDASGDNFEEDAFAAGERPFARGHFGEVWRGKLSRKTEHEWDCKPAPDTISDAFASSRVILKRILLHQGSDLRLSAEREVYFGRLLCGSSPHLARFVHTFERTPSSGSEQWLVFKDEGESLERLIYAPEAVGGSQGLQLVTQSEWWRDMRLQRKGRRTLKTILRHVFAAVDVSHAKFGIVHRDIKPANVFVKLDGDFVEARLGDFGSAVDARSRSELYGASGPSMAQETSEYSPPEVLFGDDRGVERTSKYDMWSLGVMMAEVLALGSPKAFSQISRKTTRLALERELRGVHPKARAVAYRLRAMLELCIVPPNTQVAPLLTWDCTETALMEVFKERDPLSVGFESVWTLRLLRKLLSWDPSERPTAGRALEHAFFRDSENAGGWMCVGDANERQYEWKSDCAAACVGTCA
jgi:serine/threonine protein kinase/serine/threonine protein phosphatase PrpC